MSGFLSCRLTQSGYADTSCGQSDPSAVPDGGAKFPRSRAGLFDPVGDLVLDSNCSRDLPRHDEPVHRFQCLSLHCDGVLHARLFWIWSVRDFYFLCVRSEVEAGASIRELVNTVLRCRTSGQGKMSAKTTSFCGRSLLHLCDSVEFPYLSKTTTMARIAIPSSTIACSVFVLSVCDIMGIFDLVPNVNSSSFSLSYFLLVKSVINDHQKQFTFDNTRTGHNL